MIVTVMMTITIKLKVA